MRPWWEYELPINFESEPAMSWAKTGMAQKALADGTKAHSFCRRGNLEKTPEEVLQEIYDSIGGLWVFWQKTASNQHGEDEWYLTNGEGDTVVEFSHTKGDNQATLSCVTTRDLVAPFTEMVKRQLSVTRKAKGKVFIVASGGDRPDLHEMGVVGVPFEPGNYAEHVEESYRHVVADLMNPTPCGRLTILDGCPGSGKSYLVRALVGELERGIAVLVPSNMVSAMSNPTFVGVLLRERKPNQPIVLIIEDADEALSSRKADSLSEVSAVLNYGDGLLGSTLDLRLVATTNVDLEDLDEAVVRPGRLCRRIEIGRLPGLRARAAYLRIKPDATDGDRFQDRKTYSIAEVYQAAGGGGTVLTTKEKRVGFAVEFSESVPDDEFFTDEE